MPGVKEVLESKLAWFCLKVRKYTYTSLVNKFKLALLIHEKQGFKLHIVALTGGLSADYLSLGTNT